MEHNCEQCKYRYVATSVYDFYKKSLRMPNMTFWNRDEFKHKCWLCNNPEIADIDHTNGTPVMKECIKNNFYGTCVHFRTSDAIDIVAGTVAITSSKAAPIYIDDEVTLTATVTAGTTGTTNKYQWYKDGRKLFQETSSTLSVDTSAAAINDYYCVVTESISDVGDGGTKKSLITSNTITITVNTATSNE